MSSSNGMVGFLLLVLFWIVMASCQPNNSCSTPTSEYQIEQCGMDRP